MTDLFSFEDFPDEIILEIFKYISLYDLYSGFHHLNSRLNNILHSVHNLTLILSKPHDLYHSAVSFFAPQIHHLIVRHSQHVPFIRFTSLRSLTSMFPGDQQLLEIQANDLPNLTRLTLGFMGIWDCDIIARLCQQIFSNTFPKLRFCSLWPPTLERDYLPTSTIALTHVQLKEGNLDDLCIVLDACPNLKYLQVKRIDEDQ